MLWALVVASVAQAEPGPLDAFRANYAAIHAKLDYEFTSGLAAPDVIADGRLWGDDVGFVSDPERATLGRWACDGNAEYFDCGAAGGKANEDRVYRSTGGMAMMTRQRFQLLYDGEMSLYRDRQTANVDAMVTNDPGPLSEAIGPYAWGHVYPFPTFLARQFPGMRPERRPATRGGHATEVEIYRREQEDGWHQVEVSYDPSIGSNPRYCRLLKWVAKDDRLFVKEAYVVKADVCSAGGFVPTEVRKTAYRVDRFSRNYPKFDDNTSFTATDQVELDRFVATRFVDFVGPAKIEDTAGVTFLTSYGGPRKIPGGLLNAMTIPAVKAALGTRLTAAPPPMPHLDVAEQNEFNTQRGRPWWPYLIGGLAAVAALGAAGYARKRALAVVALIGLLPAAGCGTAGPPAPRLSGAFDRPQLLYDPGRPLQLTLTLKNDGNRPLRIRAVNGGCTCRRVDPAPFPATLKVGQSLNVGVSLNDDRSFAPQNITFTADSDQGSLNFPASLHALPSHHVSPIAPANNSLVEGQGWEFDLVHRELSDGTSPTHPATLTFPAEFAATRGQTVAGSVANLPKFAFKDTTYHVTLKDDRLGLCKAPILLRAGDRTLFEVPVIWKRSRYLSTAPERVSLGTRPVRVFLRCPDEAVELTRVLSAPAGIRAVVSSPRELTVSPGDEAPPVLDGYVEVGTTAEGKPPLRVQIVRYQPVALN